MDKCMRIFSSLFLGLTLLTFVGIPIACEYMFLPPLYHLYAERAASFDGKSRIPPLSFDHELHFDGQIPATDPNDANWERSCTARAGGVIVSLAGSPFLRGSVNTLWIHIRNDSDAPVRILPTQCKLSLSTWYGSRTLANEHISIKYLDAETNNTSGGTEWTAADPGAGVAIDTGTRRILQVSVSGGPANASILGGSFDLSLVDSQNTDTARIRFFLDFVPPPI